MAISSVINRVTYSGNGSSAVFSFPYEFTATSDLLTYLYNTVTGVITSQSLNIDYTISATPNAQGIYPTGGSLTFVSAPIGSSVVVITRSPQLTQGYALGQGATISGPALVNQMDYLTLLMQRVNDTVSRAIRLKDGHGATFDVSLPDNISSLAGAVLVVNSSGTGFTFNLIVGSTAFSGILPIANGGTGAGSAPNVNGVSYGLSGVAYGTTPAGPQDYLLTATASSAPSFKQISLGSSAGVVGTLQVLNGGTGLNSSWLQTSLLYATSNSQLGMIPSAASGLVLTANGSSAPSYQAIVTPNPTTSTKSANYIAVASDSVILVNSSNFTVTLPTAAGVGGKQIFVQKTDIYNTSVITIVGTSAQTIKGFSSVNVQTQGEGWQFFSDNSNWQVTNHQTMSPATAYTPILNALGSTSGLSYFWYRDGFSLVVYGTTTIGQPQGSSGFFSISLPASFIVNSSVLPIINTTGAPGTIVGRGCGGVNNSAGNIVLAPATSLGLVYGTPSFNGNNNLTPGIGNTTWANSAANGSIVLDFRVPILGWIE